MRVWNDIERVPSGDGPLVASIGNYDGVHVGHQRILERTVAAARARHVPSLLISFEPHPLAVVAPERRPQLLQTREQKLDALEQTGLEHVLMLKFTPEIATLSGEEFFADVLDQHLTFAAMHVGHNFRFGRHRSAGIEALERIGAARGFEVSGTPQVQVDGGVVSSTRIRAAVKEGDVSAASRMLGRPFALTGEVVRGAGRGAKLLLPTANLEVENEICPAPGVYVTESAVLAARQAAMTNVGFRPTFNGTLLTVETHIIEFEGDLYGERMEVRFLDRIRDEMRFENPSDLADQLARDRAAAESYFQNLQIQPL